MPAIRRLVVLEFVVEANVVAAKCLGPALEVVRLVCRLCILRRRTRRWLYGGGHEAGHS